jgi:hypothetical protein
MKINNLNYVLIGGALASSLVLGGCATNPATGNQHLTRAGEGAIGGAAGGVVISTVLGGALPGALIAGPAGAVIGAAIAEGTATPKRY